MVGYKHPCRHCDQLLESTANVCPFCGKVNPTGPLRCPQCRSPIKEGWMACSHCGLKLEAACPKCKELTFLGDYCSKCDAQLVQVCPNPKCGKPQAMGAKKCAECGKPL